MRFILLPKESQNHWRSQDQLKTHDYQCFDNMKRTHGTENQVPPDGILGSSFSLFFMKHFTSTCLMRLFTSMCLMRHFTSRYLTRHLILSYLNTSLSADIHRHHFFRSYPPVQNQRSIATKESYLTRHFSYLDKDFARYTREGDSLSSTSPLKPNLHRDQSRLHSRRSKTFQDTCGC